MLAAGQSASAWLCEQTTVGVKSPAAGHGWAFLLHRDSEEDAEPSCARGGCLASRVASCSCELLTEGRWAQSRLEQWRAVLEVAVASGWPDRHTRFLPAASPAVDLPRPPETTAAVVTAPHSRAREAVGESLVHVPLETFLETLESPGGSGSNNTGAMGPCPSCPPPGAPPSPQAPPKPFLSLRTCDLSSPWVLCTAIR